MVAEARRAAPVTVARPPRALLLEATALLVIIGFGLLVLYPVLRAQFVLIDDHEILTLLPPIGAPPTARPVLDLRGMALVADPSVGRFRPLYWAIRLSETALLGDHPNAWHTLILVYGLVSACFLYATARALGADRLASGLLGAWLLVAPGVSSLWVRLGVDDTRATVFLVLAAFAAARAGQSMSRRASTGWDVLLVLAAVAAAFTKEAFALAIVGIAAFRAALWLRRAEHPSAIAVPPSVWLIPLAALIEMAAAAAVANSAGPFSHGGRYLVTPDPLAYVGSVAHNSAILVYVGMLWIAPLFVVAGLARNWRSVLLTCVPAAVLVLPEVLLYSLQGVFEGKYEAAPGLGVAAVSMAGIGWLKAQRKLRLYRVSLWAWSVALLAFGFSTWTYATYFTEDSIQLGMLVHAAAESQPTGTIGIAADPGRQYEPILSLLDHIRHQRPGPFEFEFLALAPDRPYSALEASLADNLMSASQAQPVERDCRGLSAMIVLGDEAATRANLPCLAQGFRRLEFSDSVLLWGGDGVSFRPRLPGLTHVGYVLFVADQSGAT